MHCQLKQTALSFQFSGLHPADCSERRYLGPHYVDHGIGICMQGSLDIEQCPAAADARPPAQGAAGNSFTS
jgi:hypothetical protein